MARSSSATRSTSSGRASSGSRPGTCSSDILRSKRAALVFAGAALLTCCSGGDPADRLGLEAERPSIVLVTLDTTRADRLGCYGGPARTPNLDALAARGARFEQASSAVPLTLPAHTTILTGTLPPRHGSRDNGVPPPAGGPTSVAPLFRDAGWATGAFVSAFVLDHRFGLADGFDTYDDGPFASGGKVVSMASLERRCDETVARALAWARTAPRPLMLWVHLFDPHHPYEPPEPFADEAATAYDGEIAFADHCVGTLLDGLRDLGLGDDAAVAVVGDHGEGLGEHGESVHGIFISESTLRVPLILGSLGPGGEGGVVMTPVSIADLAPTLLELAAIEAPAEIDGASLLPLVAGDVPARPRPVYAESLVGRLHYGWAELRAVRIGADKYIDAPRPELYDLDVDPHELDDRARREPERARTLRDELGALLAELPEREGVMATDGEAFANLAALGYVGAGGRTDAGEADPKDKIAVSERLVAARRLLESSDVGPGITALRALLADEPALLDAHFLVGWAELERGSNGAAAASFAHVVGENPRYPLAAFHLAVALERGGDSEGAIAAYAAAIEVDPRQAEAHIRRGDLLSAAGRHAEALEAYEAGIVAAPGSATLHAKLGSFLLRGRDLGRAEHHLREAVAIDDHVEVAHFNLALLAEQRGDVAAAMASYRAAIAAEPESIKPLVNLALLHEQRGELEPAVELLESALAIEPQFAPGYQLLARVLGRAGRVADARAAIERGRSVAATRP